jgi:RNA polymerase sigma factor (sigma-70 family)
MLGTVSDAEDASQEILVRVMTNLSSFRKESRFSTWVYRIAVNYLQNYKKSMFAQRPLSFEFYGRDIEAGFINNSSVDFRGVDEEMLAEELKMSCTNVMLQCLDPESRSIYILGTMFHIDSRTGGEILGMAADNYRQKLSRVRRRMGDFLSSYYRSLRYSPQEKTRRFFVMNTVWYLRLYKKYSIIINAITLKSSLIQR